MCEDNYPHQISDITVSLIPDFLTQTRAGPGEETMDKLRNVYCTYHLVINTRKCFY